MDNNLNWGYLIDASSVKRKMKQGNKGYGGVIMIRGVPVRVLNRRLCPLINAGLENPLLWERKTPYKFSEKGEDPLFPAFMLLPQGLTVSELINTINDLVISQSL